MGSGIIFYWFCWILWIIATFIMKKDKRRTFLACWILMLILFSNVYISIFSIQVSVSLLTLVGGTLFMRGKHPRIIFHSFASFTVTIGYIGILIWENYTPLRLFFPQLVTISFLLVLIITFLTNGLLNRLSSGLFGIACGEIIYSLIAANYAIQDTMGDMAFFDCVLLITMIILCQDLLLKTKLKIYGKVAVTKQSHRQQA